MDERNELIDPPADVAEPEIDPRYVEEWWRGLDLGPRPEEDAFRQALRITYTSTRESGTPADTEDAA